MNQKEVSVLVLYITLFLTNLFLEINFVVVFFSLKVLRDISEPRLSG